MTTTDAPVTVEQCDREAGLALRLYTTSIKPGDYRYDRMCADFRSGGWDDKVAVQAFARHRLAALASALGVETTCQQCDGEGEHEHAHMPVHTLQSECPEYEVVTCEQCHGTGSIPVEEPGDYLRDRLLSIATICENKGLLVEASGLRDIASIVSEQFKKWMAR